MLGRGGVFSAGLIVGFLLLGYAALRAFELVPISGPVTLQGRTPAEPAAQRAWRAHVTLGDARVLALLLPLHGEPGLEEFRAHALRSRYALPEGEPWRLYLSLEAASETPVLVSSARVGSELVPFAELAKAPEGVDPVHALLAAPPGALEVGRARPLVLWGRLPAGDAVLELASSDLSGTGALVAEDAGDAPRWYAGDERPPEAANPLEGEVARLQRELDRERARRAEREQTFMEFSKLLAQLPVGKDLGLPAPEAENPPAAPDPEEEKRREAEERARGRAVEIGRSLGVLMRLEGLRGLDLLESGSLIGDPPSAIGPVVFRCLDERGLLAGSVRAERLRLEASSSAHTLTLVLEQGYESRGGQQIPFTDGVRRIVLSDVDPEPWFKECPELFDASGIASTSDDGQWALGDVRRELNRLLALDARMGWYRLRSLGGVKGEELLDVQLEELEQSGHVARRMFADRMRILLEDGSVVLDLHDGAFVSGEQKQPFRDGRQRIVLPAVDVNVWRTAVLPGLAPPPVRERKAPEGSSGR